MGEEKHNATKSETDVLLNAGFICEAQYTTWLANVVIMNKANVKWRMCTNYTDLNKAFPNDAYPLSNIDCSVDGVIGHRARFLKCIFRV